MEKNYYQSALEKLKGLLSEAWSLEMADANVAALATASLSASPSVRMIHIQEVSPEGLLFFANRNSGKGIQLTENPRACLCFYWMALREQVIVEGAVEKQSELISAKYWEKRLRESQRVAWASVQGDSVSKKGETKEKLQSLRSQDNLNPAKWNRDWDAYRLVPDRIEFWASSGKRAKERCRYFKDTSKEDENAWSMELLQP